MTNQIANDTFAVSAEASASIHEHGVVILHASNGCIYSSNEIGARIWRRVAEKSPIRAIIDEIRNKYELAHSVAHDHVTRFLAELEQHALIYRQEEL